MQTWKSYFSFRLKLHLSLVLNSAPAGFPKLLSISLYCLAFCKANTFCWKLSLTSHSLFHCFHLFLDSPRLNPIYIWFLKIINMHENSELFFFSPPISLLVFDNFVCANSSHVYFWRGFGLIQKTKIDSSERREREKSGGRKKVEGEKWEEVCGLGSLDGGVLGWDCREKSFEAAVRHEMLKMRHGKRQSKNCFGYN